MIESFADSGFIWFGFVGLNVALVWTVGGGFWFWLDDLT